MEEIEVKFLNVDKNQVIQKLDELGALKVYEVLYKRYSYDFPDKRLAKQNAWVRVRDEGDKITMAFKQRVGVGDDILRGGGMKEIEIEVSDFNKAHELLSAIGLEYKFYEENKRTRYIIDNLEIDIDEWPLLAPYLELEGKSFDELHIMADKLGFDWDSHLKCSTMQVYEMNGINENDYKILTFEKQIKK